MAETTALEQRVHRILAAMPGGALAGAETINRNWGRLIADKMDGQKAIALLIAAAEKGEDVDAFTDHLLKLRAAFNGA